MSFAGLPGCPSELLAALALGWLAGPHGILPVAGCLGPGSCGNTLEKNTSIRTPSEQLSVCWQAEAILRKKETIFIWAAEPA